MEAIILAGGFGTRLRSVCSDRPKPMAQIRGKPFLEYLMAYWASQGVSHFILSVGYLHEVIVDYFGTEFQGIPIDYSIEKEPLGTGGGLILALEQVKRPERPFLAFNGDTYFDVPLETLTTFQKQRACQCCLSLFSIGDSDRYSRVITASNGQILQMAQGAGNASRWINGGVYLFQGDIFSRWALSNEVISLENDLLPELIVKKECFGAPFAGSFIDIGIPEDYRRAQDVLERSDALKN